MSCCADGGNSVRQMPRAVSEGRAGDLSQICGGAPAPRLRFFDEKSSSGSSEMSAWRLRSASSVVPLVFRRCSWSSFSLSESLSDESEPERLSSRSGFCS